MFEMALALSCTASKHQAGRCDISIEQVRFVTAVFAHLNLRILPKLSIYGPDDSYQIALCDSIDIKKVDRSCSRHEKASFTVAE